MKEHKISVLVIATSRRTRGGITSVIKAYEKSTLWNEYHCKWIETHRDGNVSTKLWYLLRGFSQFLVKVPYCDIVHVHTSEPASAFRKMVFVAIAKWMGKKVIVHFHSFSVDTTIKSRFRCIYKYLFDKADEVLVLSKYWQTEVCETLGLPVEKVQVLYNPCTTEVSDRTYPKQKGILYAGTLTVRKGYADLLQAFAQIAPSHEDWGLVFAGNGEMGKAQALAEELGVSHRTKFLGWVSDEEKDRTFKKASAFCLPSYAEGFPMAVLDAWAYGLPVITTPVGGIPDVAEDGHNCLLFAPGDVKGLARQMEVLMDSPALAKSIAEKSHQLANAAFSLEHIANELSEIYLKLCGQPTERLKITPPHQQRKNINVQRLAA